MQRNFATYEEIFENLSQTLILKGDASLSLYTAICKLVRSFSEIPKAFMTDSDADHMIKILDDMTSKCKQNLHNDDLEQTDVVPNFTAQGELDEMSIRGLGAGDSISQNL